MKAFQQRSRAVRAASQELMRSLREQRAAVSRHARLPIVAPQPVVVATAVPPTVPASDIKPSRKILSSTRVEVSTTAAEPKQSRRPRKETAEAIVVPVLQAPMEAPEEVPQDVAALKATPRKKSHAKKIVEQQEQMSPSHSAKPVSSVPTLGPGMVWRLNQLGVATLGDLAAQDADSLKRQLGRLGRMVNVEQWIIYAKGV